MSLADFQPETRTVKVKNVTFEVRGLSFADISSLIRTHMDDLEAVFTMYEREAQGLNFGNLAMARLATALISDAPGLVAHIIALAADSPEFVDKAARLPAFTQLDALKKIGAMTFEEVGGVKKLLEMIVELVENLQPEKSEQPKRSSPSGKK
ncbi:pre-tape measure frameshift protein [Cronobacter phage JC01]|uniref:Pre-tape measure frameshift protein n=1 Tax=Cronobacter phage JC01 TaxID=2729575 RepID=A0A6M3YKJ6_9CAUD|nr:tail length tape measure protein [Cronobacter phage JC01]QJI52241.1 pre-tape measure frameshift protein [Cronobacter phage JC01]